MRPTRKDKGRARSQPVRVPVEQAWFWTQEWQAKEREADDDLAAERYSEFENVDDLIADLKK